MATHDLFGYCLMFAVGASAGSFLNVVAIRLPHGEKLSFLRSRCPVCKRYLSLVDMVPVLSYLFLRGKCRYCGCRISPMYPAVEGTTGFIFAYLASRYGFTPVLLRQAVLLSLLVVIAITDIREMLIPDELLLSGAVFWAVYVVVASAGDVLAVLQRGILGGMLAFSLFLLISLATKGMGGGDIKLAGMCGLYLGPMLTILAIFVTFVSGGLAAGLYLSVRKAGRKSAIPYGPFIALGTAVSSLWGEQIICWYLGRLPA